MNYSSFFMRGLRIAIFGAALYMLQLSIGNSAEGFGFASERAFGEGVGIGICFSLIEFVFNKGVRRNPTLFAIGIGVYIYSIGTNFAAMLMDSTVSTTLPQELFTLSTAWWGIRVTILALLAFALDLFPEIGILFALYPRETMEGKFGDFWSSVVNGAQVQRQSDNDSGVSYVRPDTRYEGREKYDVHEVDPPLQPKQQFKPAFKQNKR
jgi:hypothetical protein